MEYEDLSPVMRNLADKVGMDAIKRVLDEASVAALNPERPGTEYDNKKWVDEISRRLESEFPGYLDSYMEELSKLSPAEAWKKLTDDRAIEKPPVEYGNSVIPEELIPMPGNRTVERGALYAHEQMWLANSKEAGSRAARYEMALAVPFLEWTKRELAKGRPQSELAQITFWVECGHIKID
jgi:hypothetical protein